MIAVTSIAILTAKSVRFIGRHSIGLFRRAEDCHRDFDLISDALPFVRLCYDPPDHAIGYVMHYSRSHDAVIRVYDAAGNVIETHEHKGDFSKSGKRKAKQTAARPMKHDG